MTCASWGALLYDFLRVFGVPYGIMPVQVERVSHPVNTPHPFAVQFRSPNYPKSTICLPEPVSRAHALAGRSLVQENVISTSFEGLGLLPELLRAVTEQGYTTPTPIQAQAIPVVISGRDLLAAAQTGTGKTAGFTLPVLQRLAPMA